MAKDIKWTEAQQNAIDARNSNILVCAAAGSGKTAVLVERVIKIITDKQNPVDIDKLLVVTFTKAAASEMKNKILKALNAVISENPNDTNALRQLSLLPNAQICTIDSFCGNLVKENFFKLDISQDYTVLDETEKSIIENLACDEVINEFYEEDSEEFKLLVELLSNSKNDSKLVDTVKTIARYMMAQPFPYLWLEGLADNYNPSTNFAGNEAAKYMKQQAHNALSEAYDILNNSYSLIYPEMDRYEKYVDLLDADKCVLDNISATLDRSVKELRNNYKDICDWKRSFTNLDEKIKNNREIYRNEIVKKIIPNYISVSEDECLEDCKKLYPLIKTLISVVKRFNDRMNSYKKERNAYTFSDIEHFAIDLLFFVNDKGEIERTDLAKDYESNFAEILVDEYQDTNYSQDMLFQQLSNGKNRFMVGDIKQSIYRFRLAMPQIFADKKENFSPYSANSNSINQKIILDANFRSRKGICDFTNFVFSLFMNKKIGELEYTSEEYLNNGNKSYAPTTVPCAQIKIIEQKDNKIETEAHHIAKMILNKIENKEQIDGRDIKFSDFAMLFRSSVNFKIYADVFAQYSIPTVVNNQENLFNNNEVVMLMSFLRVIDNPVQDVPLLATLMSPFFGYSADDIATAKAEHKGANLFASISKSEAFSKFITDIDKYRKYACSMSVSAFLRQLISDTSYLAIVSSMGNAEQRRLNVQKFISIAQRYDSGENVGLTSFVRYVDKITELKSSIDAAEFVNSGSNSVVFTTIHKSKGLEYPICILADSIHKYNKSDLSADVLLDAQNGIGVKVYDNEHLCRYDSLQYLYLKDKSTCANMSEVLRVLYVAITRAKEQFIVFVTCDNIEKKLSTLASKIRDKKISPLHTRDAVCDADFILWAALLHQDCKDLRKLAGVDNDFLVSDFEMSVDFLEDTFDNSQIQEDEVQFSPAILSSIQQKLSFNYNRQPLSGYASKRNASSLDETELGYEFFAKSKPDFLNDSGMSATQKGTAMHAFMQYCDYNRAKSDLLSEIDRLVSDGFITQQQANSLNIDKLDALFKSDFANRMFNADKIYREIKVSTFVPVNKLENTEFDDLVLIQGIADCVFEEEGKLVVVDYKTDKVESKEELFSRYKNQISFYKNAVEKRFNMPVKETLFYSFYLDDICQYK